MDPAALPLSRATVDRAAHRRTAPDAVRSAWADPRSRVLLLRGDGLAVLEEGPAVRLDLRAPQALPDPGTDLVLLLGEDPDGTTYLAVVTADAADAVPATWASLRAVGHRLGDRDAGLATTATGLAAWHALHPRCPRCGAATEQGTAGWTRRCVEDGSEHYPRTDPAVIMAVVDDADRLLLGHAAHWPDRRFSTLAGYVEPGESLEAAVRREVLEEVGVTVGEVRYQGSQPWPFPASLMLAFVARATSTAVQVDGVEVTDARWFTRDELASAVREGDVLLPSRTSVARSLVEDWFGDRLAGDD